VNIVNKDGLTALHEVYPYLLGPNTPIPHDLQGYLAHKKQRPPRNLQWDYPHPGPLPIEEEST